MPIAVTVTREGLTAELILYRAYGKAGNTSAMLAKLLKANRGLAALGPYLPLQTKLIVPDLDAPPARETEEAVSLFGD